MLSRASCRATATARTSRWWSSTTDRLTRRRSSSRPRRAYASCDTPRALGFAASCNDGAAAGSGEYVVFLNNDTLGEDGWLDALVSYADANEQAAIVGARLLYQNRDDPARRHRVRRGSPAETRVSGIPSGSSGGLQAEAIPGRDGRMHARPTQRVRGDRRLRHRLRERLRRRRSVPPRGTAWRRDALLPRQRPRSP